MIVDNSRATFVAAADINPYLVISIDTSGKAAVCTASATAVGVCETGASSGGVAAVRLFNAGGVCEVLAGGTISAGGLVSPGASGMVVASASGSTVIGVALNTVTSGGLLEIIPA